MTSFTRKLHDLDPNAALQIHRQELRDYRYGKNVTLAQFAPEAHRPFRETSTRATQHGYGYGAGLAAPRFGKREHPPALPAYECWAPELGKPKSIVHAADSWQARQVYAAHHQIVVSDVAARRR